jgi:hypothetical protein
MQGAIAAGLAGVTGAFEARRRAQCESAGDGHHQRPPLTHIVIQKSQRRSEEHGRLRKEVLGWQTRLGLLLALGFREHEDDECRTTCAFTPFSRDRRLNDLSAVCF